MSSYLSCQYKHALELIILPSHIIFSSPMYYPNAKHFCDNSKYSHKYHPQRYNVDDMLLLQSVLEFVIEPKHVKY